MKRNIQYSFENYLQLMILRVNILVGLFFGSVRSIAYKVKKDTGVNISQQTIENWVLEYEKEKKECSNVIQDITFLMWSELKLKAYGITDSLYSTVNNC